MWNELSSAPEYDMDYLMWDRRRKDPRESPIFPVTPSRAGHSKWLKAYWVSKRVNLWEVLVEDDIELLSLYLSPIPQFQLSNQPHEVKYDRQEITMKEPNAKYH